MFDRSEDAQKSIDALYASWADLERGDIITHEAIQAVLHVEPYGRRWIYCVERARRRLEDEKGYSTWSVHGVGYKVCMEQEQLDIPRLRQKKARRQVRKGLASVEALPVEGLSPHQQRVRSMRIEQMRKTDRDIASEMRSMTVMMKKQESMPRVRPSRP